MVQPLMDFEKFYENTKRSIELRTEDPVFRVIAVGYLARAREVQDYLDNESPFDAGIRYCAMMRDLNEDKVLTTKNNGLTSLIWHLIKDYFNPHVEVY